MSEKALTGLGWFATCVSVMMYVSYIPQIMNNLHGMKGTPIQPLVAAINCTLWVTYALLKKNRDYPVAMANAPGIIFGLIAAIYGDYLTRNLTVFCEESLLRGKGLSFHSLCRRAALSLHCEVRL